MNTHARSSNYETLCTQPLFCPPSFSPGNLFIILFQSTKSEPTTKKLAVKVLVVIVFDISVLEVFSVQNSEYDQEIPQSQTADNPLAPRGRATQPSRDTRKTN